MKVKATYAVYLRIIWQQIVYYTKLINFDRYVTIAIAKSQCLLP